MPYSLAKPPLRAAFVDMTEEELGAYAAWFQSMIPERVRELREAVRAAPGFEGWEPTGEPDSLEPLGRWLEGQVETRKRSEVEFEELKAGLPIPGAVSDMTLSDRTISIVLDMAMYLSQVVLKSIPGTSWVLPLDDKRNAEYGQPSLTGFGDPRVLLNPVRIVRTNASRVASGKPQELRKHYETWARMKKR